MGEGISTDSDIGTSPSGTTLASPPSSPQQVPPTPNSAYNLNSYNKFCKTFSQQEREQQQQQQQSQYNSYNNNANNSTATNNASIIRQHSYLNAVQLNDYKLGQPFIQQNLYERNERIESNNASQPQKEQQLRHKSKNYNNDSSQVYYYSPSATLAREQRNLQHLQYKQQSLQTDSSSGKKMSPLGSSQPAANAASYSAANLGSKLKKSSNKSTTAFSNEPEILTRKQQKEQQTKMEVAVDTNSSSSVGNEKLVDQSSANSSVNSLHQYRKKAMNQENRHPMQQKSQTIAANDAVAAENDENRRSSYMKATNKNLEGTEPGQVKSVKITATSQQPRSTSIKKLKSFFGEKVSFYVICQTCSYSRQ